LWAYKDNLSENPSYPLYASTIAIAATFVLRAHILTTNDPALVEDWADHFDKSARPYFVIAFLTSMSSLVAAWASKESSGFDAASIPFWIRKWWRERPFNLSQDFVTYVEKNVLSNYQDDT
jgi:hypothetical protein